MKELSIEDKAKRYDEVFNAAKEWYNNPNSSSIGKSYLYAVFPELRESEDDRIRKELIGFLRNIPNSNYTCEEMALWLEKQGDIDKTSYEIAEKEKCEFIGDGFIKCYASFQDFKEGETYWLEYIGNDNYNVRSDNLLGRTYHITPCQLYTIFKKQTWLEKQGTQPRFNIGDVICDKLCTTLNKDAQPNMEIVDIQNGIYICDKGSFPVSQQDEYVLVSRKIDTKLNDDSVSNELRAASFAHAKKEILNPTFPNNEEFELVYTFEEGAKWDAAQKSVWSKDDEYRTEKLLGWLNTLINYIQGDATISLDLHRERKRQVEQLKTWLKSLKALNTWKPSDKQMEAFEHFVKSIGERGYFSPYDDNTKLLYSLLEDLKKLK